MKSVSCLLIDDDVDEHEIFYMAIEENFDCSDCWCAKSIQQAIEMINSGFVKMPDYIFVDWSVVRSDATSNINQIRKSFPKSSSQLIVLSGLIPLIDSQALGIDGVYKKQNSIEQYANMLGRIMSTKSTASSAI